MKSHAAQAFLLSACAYPGAGHIYLKKHLLGALIIITATLCLVMPGMVFVDVCLAFIDNQYRQTPPGTLMELLDSLSSVLNQAPEGAYYSLYFLAISWIGSSLDAFRVGRIKDRAESAERVGI